MHPWIELAPGIAVTGSGAAWLSRHGTVVVADIHVGYELAAQRRGGYLPPVESGEAIGTRLARLATSLGATRLVIAGDLRHSTRDVDSRDGARMCTPAPAV